jgi:small subunit ribosomal protein S6
MEEDRLTTGSTEAVTPEPAAPVARTRAYEGMFVAFNKEARKTHEYLEEHIQALLTKVGAKVVRFHKWDQRQLAFEINGQREGIYYLVYFEAPTDVIAHLKREAELSEPVLRALVWRSTASRPRRSCASARRRPRRARGESCAARRLRRRTPSAQRPARTAGPVRADGRATATAAAATASAREADAG